MLSSSAGQVHVHQQTRNQFPKDQPPLLHLDLAGDIISIVHTKLQTSELICVRL